MYVKRKQPELAAHQWFKNGDHPGDRVGEVVADPLYPDDRSKDYERLEGLVVRFFRRPEPIYSGELIHDHCGHTYHDHGWIDVAEEGLTVCPGDWIVKDPDGNLTRHNPLDFYLKFESV